MRAPRALRLCFHVDATNFKDVLRGKGAQYRSSALKEARQRGRLHWQASARICALLAYRVSLLAFGVCGPLAQPDCSHMPLSEH
jgi:hypothetical protein